MDDLRARGGKRSGFTKASASAVSKGRVATVVMFILVPQVSFKKRLDIEYVVHKWSAQTSHLVLNNWPEVKINA